MRKTSSSSATNSSSAIASSSSSSAAASVSSKANTTAASKSKNIFGRERKAPKASASTTTSAASAVAAKERLQHLMGSSFVADAADSELKASSKVETAIASASEGNKVLEAAALSDVVMEPVCAQPEQSAAQGDGRDLKAGSDFSQESKVYPVVVYTADELKAAQDAHAERIVVKGELAQKLESALKGLRSLSASSLNALALVLSGAALFAPFTGGVSLGAAGTVMGTVGAALTATAIAAISAIGLSLVFAVLKGYDEVKLAGGGLELSIKKHKDKDQADQAKQAKKENELRSEDAAKAAKESEDEKGEPKSV